MSILFLNVGSNSVFCSNLIELVFFFLVGLLVVPTFMRKKRKKFQKQGLYHMYSQVPNKRVYSIGIFISKFSTLVVYQAPFFQNSTLLDYKIIHSTYSFICAYFLFMKSTQNIHPTRLHAIWSYNERWDFPRAGSSLFLPTFSGLTFLRFLGPFFIFSEIFASGVLYFLH